MSVFTYCSDEGTAAVIDALPDKYPMELNRSDMAALCNVLQVAFDCCENDWAGDFLSSIAQTVGIEFV